jgi:hypothetical protein
MAKKSFGWNFPLPKQWQKKAQLNSLYPKMLRVCRASVPIPKPDGDGWPTMS